MLLVFVNSQVNLLLAGLLIRYIVPPGTENPDGALANSISVDAAVPGDGELPVIP
ncbi:hypothetical protein D3C87_1968950 [compost metagenome]